MNDDISVLDMQIQDVNSEYLGVSRLQLMENAGTAVAQTVMRDPGFSTFEAILILCGTGGNGGDGLVAARKLAPSKKIRILILGDIEKTRSAPTRHNWEMTKRMFLSTKIVVAKQKESIPEEWFLGKIVIIDGILGTGITGELREPIRTTIQLANAAKSRDIPIYAIDCPTGVDPQTGETKSDWIQPSYTIALHKKKVGLTPNLCGKIVLSSIGMPLEAEFVAGPGDLLAIPLKNSEARKGDSGKVLVIGGSQEYTGAPALAALAALRGGADLAIVAAPAEVANSIRSYSPELIVRGFEGSHLNLSSIAELENLISWADVAVIGPGLGIDAETKEAFQILTKNLNSLEKAVILDADALKTVNKDILNKNFVLTPHSGEFLALTGNSLPLVSDNFRKRWELVKQTAKNWKCTFLVKGKWDIIADEECTKINRSGCPEMTLGGTGDVLAGLTAALYAKCRDPFRSAVVGAFLNGVSGEMTLKQWGYLTPLRMIQTIPKAMGDARTRI
ncbi:MAG: NAD(P)H-hydrate dehydratase [Candidatus Hodarchaeales archaeon]